MHTETTILRTLARDGSNAQFNYCPAPTVCPDAGPARFEVLRYCRSGTTADCDIYARGRRIVWPHAFPWYVAPEVLYDYRESIGATDRWPGPGDAITTAPEATGNLSKRIIAFMWEGFPGILMGTVEFPQGARSGNMTFTLPDNAASCDGRFWFTNGAHGNWKMDCGGGFTAEGRFTGLGAGRGSRGEGTDSLGHKVQFVLGAEGTG